jgi:hypothetical protein
MRSKGNYGMDVATLSKSGIKFPPSAFIAALVLTFSFAPAVATARDSVAVPANYRQLAAAKLRQMINVSTIRSPQISWPQERWLGVFHGGMRPAICVRLITPNILGMPGAYFYLFWFDNGRVDGFQQGAYNFVQQAMIGCDNKPLTPYTELVRSR